MDGAVGESSILLPPGTVFVLLSQNRQAAKDRARADIEYDVNLRAELEVAERHEKIDGLQADVLARLDALAVGRK